MATGAIIARIISEYSDKGSKQAQKDINKLGKGFDDFGKKVAKSFAVAAAASAFFAIKIGADAVKAAMQDQKSQALLANSLRNTVGATEGAIASVEKYITKQQALFSVADDQLRPSLSALAAATGSITIAQKLQNVALDIAADKQIDLQTASVLLAKGYNGNLVALKKLYPQISATTVKTKDFKGALDLVAKASGGAAAAAAGSLAGRLEGLKIAYGEVLETLGYALLPVIQKFATYLLETVLPAIQMWVDANKDKLAAALSTATDFISALLVKMGMFAQWITDNLGMIKVFASILAGLFVGAKIAQFVVLIGTVTKAFSSLKTAAMLAGVAESFATGGASVALGLAGVAVIATTLAAYDLMGGFDSASKSADKLGKSTKAATSTSYLFMAGTEKVVSKVNSQVNVTGKLTAEQIKAAKVAAQLLSVNKALAGMGVEATNEKNPIELEAARLNLVKQQNIEAQVGLDKLISSYEAMMKNSQEAQRYSDILGVIADKNISSEEVQILAAKWGITKEKVVAYIGKVFEVPALIDPTEAARLGFKGSLDLLDQIIAKIKIVNGMPVNPGGSGTGGGEGAGTGGGEGAGTGGNVARIPTEAELNGMRYQAQADAAAAAAKAVADANSSRYQAQGDAVMKQLALTAELNGQRYQAQAPSISTASFGVSSPTSNANSSSGGVIVNVYNAGSVISNTDLVASVTQGVLQGQLSGKAITLNSTAF